MSQKIVIALVSAFLGAGVALLIEGTPEQQARRDVARCTEVARIMMSQNTGSWTKSRPPQAYDEQDLFGYTFTCLMGKR